jgi:hypothetical protein
MVENKLADNEDCCCEDDCQRCDTTFVDDIDAPTLTRYPETVIVTIDDITYDSTRPLGLLPHELCEPEDCDMCDTINGSYALSINSLSIEQGNWDHKTYTIPLPFHYATADRIRTVFLNCVRDNGSPIFIPVTTCRNFPLPPECVPGTYHPHLVLRINVLQPGTTGPNVISSRVDLTLSGVAGVSGAQPSIMWQGYFPQRRYTWPCRGASDVIFISAIPDTLTLDRVTADNTYAPRTTTLCNVPDTVELTFTDWRELPLVRIGTPVP